MFESLCDWIPDDGVERLDEILNRVSCSEDQRVRLWKLDAAGAEGVDVVMSDAPCVQLVALGREATAVAVLDEAGAIWIFNVGEARPAFE